MLVLDTTILIDALHRKDGALIKIIELEETKETLCTTNVDRFAHLAAFHFMVSILPSLCRAGSRPSGHVRPQVHARGRLQQVETQLHCL